MTHTTNYNLSQWDAGDRILRDDFNADNAKIDAALATHTSSIASLTSGKGNCSVETFTYTGTGGYGATSPTYVRFRAVPKVYFILGPLILAGNGGGQYANISANDPGAVNSSVKTSWSGSILIICGESAVRQANLAKMVYTVVAFYAES